mmetsp:Transcript_22009/g.38426  ORF Transcript_22009/g.38426 Transcript_22009/m.38426 type:complete len:112 (-) Transcript_22009:148-483(-)
MVSTKQLRSTRWISLNSSTKNRCATGISFSCVKMNDVNVGLPVWMDFAFAPEMEQATQGWGRDKIVTRGVFRMLWFCMMFPKNAEIIAERGYHCIDTGIIGGGLCIFISQI